jgi:ankyrin repeat protein
MNLGKISKSMLKNPSITHKFKNSKKNKLLFDSIIKSPSNVPILLEHGADPNIHNHDQDESTPLHYACQYQPSVVPILLEYGANPNMKNEYGRTPLHKACDDQPSVIPILLEYRADPNITDYDGYTPLYFACIHQPSVVPILLKHGANPNIGSSTPLHIACESQPSIVPILMEYGADPDIKNKYGYTSLHYACKYQPSVVEILLYVTNPNIKDDNGYTPLHDACQYQPFVVQVLLKHGADPNIRNKYDQTPLHDACKYQPSVVPILLEHGADPNIKDKNKNTPLSIAYKHPFVIPFIIPFINKENAIENINNLHNKGFYREVKYLCEKFNLEFPNDNRYKNAIAKRELNQLSLIGNARTPSHYYTKDQLVDLKKQGFIPTVDTLKKSKGSMFNVLSSPTFRGKISEFLTGKLTNSQLKALADKENKKEFGRSKKKKTRKRKLYD